MQLAPLTHFTNYSCIFATRVGSWECLFTTIPNHAEKKNKQCLMGLALKYLDTIPMVIL